MSLLNFIKEFVHSDFIKEYNIFVQNNEDAIKNFLFNGYRPRRIIANKDLHYFQDYDNQRDAIQKDFPVQDIANLNYEQKKLLFEKRDVIVQLFSVFKKNKEIVNQIELLFEKLPHAVNSLCKEVAEKTINGVDMPHSWQADDKNTISKITDLSTEEMILIIKRKDELLTLEEELVEIIEKEKNHALFESKVLANEKRKKYYVPFLQSKSIEEYQYEEYCVNHITQLDNYIKREIENKYQAIVKKYPVGISTFQEIYPDSSHELILTKEDVIKDFEHKGQQALKFNNWEKEQEEFTHMCRSLRLSNSFLTRFRTKHRYIDFPINDKYGNIVSDKFLILQFYCGSLCLSENLDYTHFNSYKENRDNLPRFKKHSHYFKDAVYQQIADYINHLSEKEEVFVYFNHEVPGWNYHQLTAHYNQLRDLLNDNVLIKS